MSYMDRGDVSVDVDVDFDDVYTDGLIDYNIPINKNYRIIELIAILIVGVTCMVGIIFADTSVFVDPIQNIKKIYINTYLITILGIIILFCGICFKIKKIKKLIKTLYGLVGVSIAIIVIFLGVRMSFDKIYTKEKFSQIYVEQIEIENDKLSVAEEIAKKDKYINSCVNLYQKFKLKTYWLLGLNLFINMLISYYILKLNRIQIMKERLKKDDLVMNFIESYDREETDKKEKNY